MNRVAVFPSRYVQGPGALARFGQEAARLGQRILMLADETLPETVVASVGHEGVEMVLHGVAPTCTDAAIAAAAQLASETKADAIAGLGGGKVIDLARATADQCEVPFISVPTAAASDAACSALAVVYDEAGHVLRDQHMRWNPALVVVDSIVIAHAPARLFAAGIGDALATFGEALACFRSGAANVAGGGQTEVAMALARSCDETIRTHAETALAQCRAGTPGPEFEAVLEATILMSGIGFESGGVAAAHAVHHGLADWHETQDALHGEKVAFGHLVEEALNGADHARLTELADFNRRLGLPANLADLGITDPGMALPVILARATRSDEIIHNEPTPVTIERLRTAIIAADRAGQTAGKQAGNANV